MEPGRAPTGPQGQICYHGKGYNIVREGLAEILDPLAPAPADRVSSKRRKVEETSARKSVFYNPIQQYNRDLSVLAIRVFVEDFERVRASRAARRKNRSSDVEQNAETETDRVEQNCNTNGTDQQTKADNVNARCETSGIGQAIGRDGNQESKTERLGQNHKRTNHPEPVTDTKTSTHSEWNNDHHSELNPEIHKISTQTESNNGHLSKPNTDRNNTHHSEQKNKTSTSRTPLRILDALSATGLRALRYSREIPYSILTTANDLSPNATAAIRLNVEHNELHEKVQVATSDAIEHMQHAHKAARQYHVIDLDPYGTAAPFLDAAVRAVVDGGLLCITCTDAGVFASVGYLEKTFSQYGGLPLRGPHAHEAGLRLVLHSVATCAARYGIAIEPLLSLSIDFYVRIFVRVRHSPLEVKFLASKTMLVYNCDSGCGAWALQFLARANRKENKIGQATYTFSPNQAPSTDPNCQYCGSKTHLAGPMWGGPLHNTTFVAKLLALLPSLDPNVYHTLPRMEGMLVLALNEHLENYSDRPVEEGIVPVEAHTRANHPFFVNPSALSRILHCVSPSDAAFRGALATLGYQVSRSHTKPGSIVTNAPWTVIWEIMREWVRQKSPIKPGSLKPGSPGWRIMAQGRDRAPERALLDGMTKIQEGLRTGQAFADATGDLEELIKRSEKLHEAHVLEIKFDEELGRKLQDRGRKLVRYQQNPLPDWGPIQRASGS